MTQPGPRCVPLRPLGVADILDGSFRAIRHNPRAILGPAAVIAVLQVALIAVIQLSTSRTLSALQLQLLGTVIISAVLGTVLSGLLAVVVSQDVLGVRLTARETLARLRGRILALFGLAVVITILEAFGLLAFLVVGVWLWALWAVAVPAMVVERTTIRGALGRSRQLVAGQWWRVWGIRALGYLLTSVLNLMVSVPFLFLASALTNSGFLPDPRSGTSIAHTLIIAVGSVLSTTLTAPIRAGIDALLYLDLRMRREGLDIVLQQAARVARSTRPVVSAQARSAF